MDPDAGVQPSYLYRSFDDIRDLFAQTNDKIRGYKRAFSFNVKGGRYESLLG